MNLSGLRKKAKKNLGQKLKGFVRVSDGTVHVIKSYTTLMDISLTHEDDSLVSYFLYSPIGVMFTGVAYVSLDTNIPTDRFYPLPGRETDGSEFLKIISSCERSQF